MRRAARKGLMATSLVVALLGAAAPHHALAHDFQPGSTVTLRLTDQGPVGALTILANTSASGALGADGVLGLLLPDGHTIVGVTSTNASAGLTALFASGTLAPSQADLAGTWRVAHYSGQQGPGGLTETAFGTLVVDPLGAVAGALQYSDGVTRTIVDGNANISGSWTIRVSDGERARTIDAVGVMSRDTGFIAAVTSEQTRATRAA